MKRLKRFLISLLVLIAVAYGGISYLLSNRVLQTNSTMERTVNDISVYWGTTFEEMMTLLPPPVDINVLGADEVEINGKYFIVSDSAQCVFIFAHGWGRNWPNMLKYYPMVDDCGCNVVMYDHRAHGESGGDYPTGGIKEGEDLLALTKWMNESYGYDPNQIAWLGSSWGAAAALMAGAADQDPAFIVVDAPFQDWYSAIFERAIKDYGNGIKLIAPGVMKVVNWRTGVNYKEASALLKMKDIKEPVLLIHSESDPETSSSQSVNLSKLLNDRSEFHHTQWGNEHVMDVINNKEEMKQLLMNFLEKNQFELFLPSDTTTFTASK